MVLPIDVIAESAMEDLPQIADLDGLDLTGGDEAEHVRPADVRQTRGLRDRVQKPVGFRVVSLVSRSRSACSVRQDAGLCPACK